MESYVSVILFSGICLGEWVEIPPVFPKLQKFNDSRSGEFSCPDIHNLTMMMYSVQGPETRENNFSEEDDRPEAGEKGSYNFLESMKENLMTHIEERIKRLGAVREARGKHMDFPSMETALITISLLLFAVYLIKLVMKILQSLQAKKGQMNANLNLLVGRRKRSNSAELETIKMMEILDKYNTLFH